MADVMHPVPALVVLGSGGHARVLAEAAQLSGWTIAGHVGPEPGAWQELGPHLGDDDAIPGLIRQGHAFALAFGFVNAHGAARRSAFLQRLVGLGAPLPVIRHPSAVVSPSARIAAGSFIAAGAVIMAGADLGAGTIVNTGAIIDHGCRIGANTHAATGARLAGDVEVGENVLLGIGCMLRHGVRVGSGAVVGAGAVVVRAVPAASMVVGNPARIRQGQGVP